MLAIADYSIINPIGIVLSYSEIEYICLDTFRGKVSRQIYSCLDLEIFWGAKWSNAIYILYNIPELYICVASSRSISTEKQNIFNQPRYLVDNREC